MPKSADTTPLPTSLYDEDSEVLELTEEVTKKVSPVTEEEDVAGLDELAALGLEVPEFKLPAEDFEEDDDDSPATARISASALQAQRKIDLEKFGLEESEASEVEDSEELSLLEEEDEESYDRQAMVKTIQMNSIDREAFETLARARQEEINRLLEDPRFSPEVIATPPRVLVKKWQEGVPGSVLSVIGEERRAPQIPDEPSSEEDDRDTDVAPPQVIPPDLRLLEEDSEPIELNEELIEFEDETPARKATPPSGLPPEVQEVELRRNEAPDDGIPEPPATAEVAAPRSGEGKDPEMKGLVKELLEEKKDEGNTKRLRPRDVWFQDVFSEEYLRTIPENIEEITTAEVDFIRRSLKLKKGSRILDLACGFGRHSLELAAEGFEMVGLDLSMALLQKALSAAQKRSLNVKFIHGDMRELTFSGIFDGAFVWDTSIGYFDDRTNLRVLQGVHRSLKNGGRILIDVINRDYVVHQTPTRLWWEGKGCIFLEESEFDYNTSTLHAKRSFIYEDGTRPLEQNSYIRLYNAHELRQMLHVAGFKVLELSGERHHKGYFLGASSRRIIILAEKRVKKK